MQPGGAVAAAHVQPKQSETFTAIEDVLDLRVGRQGMRLAPGESATVEAGTAQEHPRRDAARVVAGCGATYKPAGRSANPIPA